ncbi:hypothetical protein FGO68_gene11706 [Halteria grandinella]|uniref:Uncharacterized protein n=1 Tax=Halteria grandinella TaxID=5974 RepID=A0A8J8SYP6_HALGN|nr:hypothetical protein FGO68_gene11706 [Halteria grandinella]
MKKLADIIQDHLPLVVHVLKSIKEMHDAKIAPFNQETKPLFAPPQVQVAQQISVSSAEEQKELPPQMPPGLLSRQEIAPLVNQLDDLRVEDKCREYERAREEGNDQQLRDGEIQIEEEQIDENDEQETEEEKLERVDKIVDEVWKRRRCADLISFQSALFVADCAAVMLDTHNNEISENLSHLYENNGMLIIDKPSMKYFIVTYYYDR